MSSIPSIAELLKQQGAGEDVCRTGMPPPLPPRPSLLSRASSKGLAKPIAIPATSTSLGSPFLRAYPTELAAYGIDSATFLNFLDELNKVAVVSPPLIMLSICCNVAGFVPEPTVQIMAFSTDLVNNATMYAVSKGRTEMTLRKANEQIFKPHGLKAQVAKLEVVAYLSGMPILDEDKKVIKGSTILAPHEDVHEIHTLSGQERRLKALEPWVSPLDIQELPEMQEQTNPINKLSVSLSEWQRGHGEKKLMTGRKKALDKHSADQQKAFQRLEKDLESILKERNKIWQKKGWISDEDEVIISQKRQVAVEKYEQTLEELSTKRDKNDKEEKGVKKIHFLLLSNAEDNAGSISGMDSEMGSDHDSEPVDPSSKSGDWKSKFQWKSVRSTFY